MLDYVLGRPDAQDARLIDDAIVAAIETVPVLMREGAQTAMQRLHARNPEAGAI